MGRPLRRRSYRSELTIAFHQKVAKPPNRKCVNLARFQLLSFREPTTEKFADATVNPLLAFSP
jgi:hypothetical protein